MEEQQPPLTARRIGAVALLLSASVLLSRVLGFVRDVVLAHRVGAGSAADAYNAAFQIPDLLNHLLAGGALSIAFVPLYTRYLARGDDTEAEHLFSTVLGTIGALVILATGLLWWFAEPLVSLQYPRFDAATKALTVHLTRIILPAQIFFVTGGIINATLLARNRFGASAAAPLLYNGGIILGGVLVAQWTPQPIEGFAWGALIGALAGPFLGPLWDTRGRVHIRLRFAPFDRVFLRYLWVAVPLMLGQSLLTVDEWYTRWFGALLEPGTVAQLSYARRLMLVPVAVVGQAIAAAALPILARLWAEKREDDMNRTVERTLGGGLALAVIGAGGFVVLAAPLVRLMYLHGSFTPADAVAVAMLLSVMSLAVPAWIVQQIAVRAFYARGDTWRPMLLGTGIAIAAIPLYLELGRVAGAPGLATAGVIGMSINAIATLAYARFLHGAPDLAALGSTLGRSTLIATAAGLVAFGILAMLAPRDSFADFVALCVCGTAYLAVVAGGILVIGDSGTRDAAQQIVSRLRSRRRG